MSKKSTPKRKMPKSVAKPGKPANSSMLTGNNTHKKPSTF